MMGEGEEECYRGKECERVNEEREGGGVREGGIQEG